MHTAPPGGRQTLCSDERGGQNRGVGRPELAARADSWERPRGYDSGHTPTMEIETVEDVPETFAHNTYTADCGAECPAVVAAGKPIPGGHASSEKLRGLRAEYGADVVAAVVEEYDMAAGPSLAKDRTMPAHEAESAWADAYESFDQGSPEAELMEDIADALGWSLDD